MSSFNIIFIFIGYLDPSLDLPERPKNNWELKYVIHLVYAGTGQLVPKSNRTLVNSYPFLVNSYLSQLVPKSTRTLVYL